MLQTTTPPSFQPTDEMIELIYWANNQPGALERQRQYIASNTRAFKTKDVGATPKSCAVLLQMVRIRHRDLAGRGADRGALQEHDGDADRVSRGRALPMEIPERFSEDLARWVSFCDN